ncbi:MAG TPA: Gfo/Idh/MocA family oxidoreductase [Ktedonobacterales bacterium]|jgi:predicted dehydrogenase|nr:Gfo/Idh/MocA family oxidoreductase [Ktedonobacterales bacterium]
MENPTQETGELVRWGVISTANIGVKAVIPAIEASRNGRLVAIGSRDLARAERIALRERGVRAFGSYEALLEDPEIDAVYIPLPNGQHLEWTTRALRAGKHVLCEKPLGLTAAEVGEMFDTSEQSGALLMEAFMYRFHPQIAWAREQVAAGRIGPVRLIRSAFVFDIRSSPDNIRLKASLGGGSLMDVGCYPLSLCRIFFEGAPVRAVALTTEPPDSEVELGVSAALDFGEGRRALIDSSFELPWRQFAEIVGEKGRITIPLPFTPGRVEAVVRVDVEDEAWERRFAAVDQYQLQVEHFADCIQRGERPAITRADSVAQAEAIEMIYAAAGYRWPR